MANPVMDEWWMNNPVMKYQLELEKLQKQGDARLMKAKQEEKRVTWQVKAQAKKAWQIYSMNLNDEKKNVRVIQQETGKGHWELYNAKAEVQGRGVMKNGVFDQLNLKPEMGRKLRSKCDEAGRVRLIALPGNSLESNHDGYVFLCLACESGQTDDNSNVFNSKLETDQQRILCGIGYLSLRFTSEKNSLLYSVAEVVEAETGHSKETIKEILASFLRGFDLGVDELTLHAKSKLDWQGEQGVKIDIDIITAED